MEARNRQLSEWFVRIENGQLRLPRFQRHEAWGVAQVEGLLTTVMGSLPAGSVLILEVNGPEPFISRAITGASDPGKDKANEHLLDGQQRLTALWRSLTDHYDDRVYFINVKPDEEDDSPYIVASYPRYIKNGKWYPVWLNDPVEVWKRGLIPVSLLLPGNKGESISKEWAKTSSRGDASIQLEIIEHLNGLRNLVSGFNIPFLSLPSTTDPSIALDVFIKMNTSASPLTPFDIVVAQAEAQTGESLHDKIVSISDHLPDLSNYIDPKELFLAVGALLHNRPPVRRSYLERGFPKFLIENFSKILRAAQRAIGVLEEERVFFGSMLPSENSLYVLCALWARDDVKLDDEGNLRALSKRYLWSSWLTDRYEKTASTRSLADFKQIVEFFEKRGPSGLPEIFDRSIYRLPNQDDYLAAGWPGRNERLARAIIILSLRGGAYDFADGSEINAKNYRRRELHHIYPRGFIGSAYPNSQINRALNCAIISMPTNRTISSKDPVKYLSDRIDGNDIGLDEVKRRVESHLIPFDAFANSDFDAFLVGRSTLLDEYVRNKLKVDG